MKNVKLTDFDTEKKLIRQGISENYDIIFIFSMVLKETTNFVKML